MKTLANSKDFASIRSRVAALAPQDQALWGSMTVNQALCHLHDSFHVALGRRPAAPLRPPSIPLPMLIWLALKAPIPWPKGVETAPEVKQGIGGTPPGEFPADLDRLLASLDAFAASPGPWPAHPIFGPLTGPQWMRWGFLHTDHHLRQFGR